MNNSVTISGDIIASTSLTAENKELIRVRLNDLKKLIEAENENSYVRISKGDYIECYLPDPKSGLRVALLIKSFVKSLDVRQAVGGMRFKYFNMYGIRLAVGIGTIDRVDREHDIIDGEAIYLSGRLLDRQHTSDKEKIVIKNTFYFASLNKDWQDEFEAVFALLDILFSKLTAKQCEVLFYKLQNTTDEEIALRLDKKQNTINEHSTLSGWNAIEGIIKRFENVIQ